MKNWPFQLHVSAGFNIGLGLLNADIGWTAPPLQWHSIISPPIGSAHKDLFPTWQFVKGWS